MYNIFSLLPEDTPFHCRVCAPGETHHVDVIMTEMLHGMKDVLDSVMAASADVMEYSDAATVRVRLVLVSTMLCIIAHDVQRASSLKTNLFSL